MAHIPPNVSPGVTLRYSAVLSGRITQVDWENDLILINQEKTDVPLKLPLRPVVGNAIYDYICQERPKCRCV